MNRNGETVSFMPEVTGLPKRSPSTSSSKSRAPCLRKCRSQRPLRPQGGPARSSGGSSPLDPAASCAHSDKPGENDYDINAIKDLKDGDKLSTFLCCWRKHSSRVHTGHCKTTASRILRSYRERPKWGAKLSFGVRTFDVCFGANLAESLFGANAPIADIEPSSPRMVKSFH